MIVIPFNLSPLKPMIKLYHYPDPPKPDITDHISVYESMKQATAFKVDMVFMIDITSKEKVIFGGTYNREGTFKKCVEIRIYE